MSRWLCVTLVLLRLVIGWHFLYEGWLKVSSSYFVGDSATGKSFSSAGYFREAPGPLGDAVRAITGDPDAIALDRLGVGAIPAGQDAATTPPKERVPPGVKKEYEAYLAKFRSAYPLDREQDREAEAKMEQAFAKAVAFLTYAPPVDAAAREKDPNYAVNTSEQTRSFPSGDVKRRMTMAERVAEYREKLKEYREGGSRNWAFGRDVEGAKARTTKAEVTKLRASVTAEMDRLAEEYKADLDKILTKDQRAMPPVDPRPAATFIDTLYGWAEKLGVSVKEARGRDLIKLIDDVTPWALLVIGACLLAGLFSRTAAASAALFLLMTYLAVPAFPWLPAPPASEGSYLFVNKNVVEMAALCVLAVSDSGKWFGVDAIFAAIGKALFGKKKKPAPTPAAAPAK